MVADPVSGLSMSAPLDLPLELQFTVQTRPEVEHFPYRYTMSGQSMRPLPSWPALHDLLHLLGLDRSYYYLIVERDDLSGRWAQVIGHPERMAVELGVPGAPMRVYRSADDQSDVLLASALGYRVDARQSDLFTAAEAHVLLRTWLESGLLGLDGTALRTPDDWK